MTNDRHSDRFEIINIPITPEHMVYVEDCTPDLHYPSFTAINVDELAGLGASHVLIDVDGTVTTFNGRGVTLNEQTTAKLKEIAEDDRFKTISLATENMDHPENLLEDVGLKPGSKVFQPYEIGKLGTAWKTTDTFWRKILFELDAWDNPETIVMIGDSPKQDIAPAQKHGLKTVLVDRLVQKRLPLQTLLN